MNSFTFTFEDAPLFADGLFETGYVTGEIEVSYSDNGDWTAHSISIEVEDNRRESKTVHLDSHRDNVFWSAIIKSRTDAIDDAVEETLSYDGISIPAFGAEHRLGYRELMGAR